MSSLWQAVCKRRKIEMIPIRAKYRAGTIIVEAFVKDDVIGTVWAERLPGYRGASNAAHVTRSQVDDEYQRKGIATRLYRVAAVWSCAKWGLPLRSGRERSRAAEWFWRKQLEKGRARYVTDMREREGYYELTCPAPKSLARMR